MKTVNCILFIMMAISLSITADAQKDSKKQKIRSIIVYQEKYDMLVAKKYKDTEQYFDERGNLTEDITYKQGKVTKHFKYQYDPDNNKIREEEFDPSGKIIESSEYKYENGMRTEKYVYDSKKKLKSKKTYHYTTF